MFTITVTVPTGSLRFVTREGAELTRVDVGRVRVVKAGEPRFNPRMAGHNSTVTLVVEPVR